MSEDNLREKSEGGGRTKGEWGQKGGERDVRGERGQ